MRTSNKSGTIYLSVSNFVFLLTNYISSIVLARFLGPESYGIFGVVISLMTLVNLIQNSSMTQSLTKFVAESNDKSEEILKSALLLQVLITLAMSVIYFICAKPIAIILRDLSLIPYIQLSAFIFPTFGIYATYLGYYNGLHYFRKQALLTITYSIAKAVFVTTLAIFFNIFGAIWGFILSPIIAILTGVKIPSKGDGYFPFKKLIVFSLPLIGFSLLSILQQSLDLYFVKALLPNNNAAGFYTANQNIARIPIFMFSALSTIIFPNISNYTSNKLDLKSKQLIQQTIRLSLLLLVPLVLLVSITSTDIVTLFYSSAYSPAAPSLSVLIFGSGFLTIFYLLTNIINASGKPGKSLLISILGTIITAAFCVFTIPMFGIIGASIATTLGGLISMIIAFFYVRNRFKIESNVISSIKIVFSSLIVSGIFYFISVPLFFLPLFYIGFFLVYFFLLRLVNGISQDDILLAKSFLSPWIKKP